MEARVPLSDSSQKNESSGPNGLLLVVGCRGARHRLTTDHGLFDELPNTPREIRNMFGQLRVLVLI